MRFAEKKLQTQSPPPPLCPPPSGLRSWIGNRPLWTGGWHLMCSEEHNIECIWSGLLHRRSEGFLHISGLCSLCIHKEKKTNKQVQTHTNKHTHIHLQPCAFQHKSEASFLAFAQQVDACDIKTFPFFFFFLNGFAAFDLHFYLLIRLRGGWCIPQQKFQTDSICRRPAKVLRPFVCERLLLVSSPPWICLCPQLIIKKLDES